MFRTLLALAAVVAQAASPDPSWTTDDESIYLAIMTAGELRRQVDRVAAGAGLPVPAPMVLFDRSVKLCEPSVPPTRPMGCLLNEHLEAFVSGKIWNGREFFSGQLSTEARRDLAGAFRERNRDAVLVQGLTLKNVIWTAPAALDTTLNEVFTRARGYVGFSRPGYSAGWALVEIRYRCGGLCGYSWYYLLTKRGESWFVVGTELLLIS